MNEKTPITAQNHLNSEGAFFFQKVLYFPHFVWIYAKMMLSAKLSKKSNTLGEKKAYYSEKCSNKSSLGKTLC